MKKVLLLSFLSLFTTVISFSQSSIKEKLKNIDGKIDEIIIKSDGKEYSFIGDEVDNLFNMIMKPHHPKHFKFNFEDGKFFKCDSSKKTIIIKDLNLNDDDIDIDNDDEDILIYLNDDNNLESDDVNIQKKVIVNDQDGKKIVTVTTNEDGKETVQIYEGQAADEYLDKMRDEKEIKVKVDVDNDSNDKRIKKIIIEKNKEVK
jgi:hypothetical protein